MSKCTVTRTRTRKTPPPPFEPPFLQDQRAQEEQAQQQQAEADQWRLPTRMGPGETPLHKGKFQMPFHLMFDDFF